MASTATAIPPCPVMTMTGTPTLSSSKRRNSSIPLISGIRTSVMMQPSAASGNTSRNAFAESKLLTSSSALRSKNASDSRRPSSSSMTCTTRNAAAFSDAIAVLLFVDERQREGEDRAAARIWPLRDRAAMRLNNRARDRQPDAHAVGFGGDEGLKELVGDLGRDAAAGIGDADFDHIIGGGGGGDDEFARRRGFHRVDRVANQVEQNLLHLHFVSENVVEPRRECETHPHALVFGPNQRQCARF